VHNTFLVYSVKLSKLHRVSNARMIMLDKFGRTVIIHLFSDTSFISSQRFYYMELTR